MNLAELKEAYKAKKLAFDTAKKEEEKYKAHITGNASISR